MNLVPVNRRLRRFQRGLREARMLARALKYPYQPVAAHLIPIRRCNLSCTYCNEYDDHSDPVPTADVLHRVDRLAALGTGILTLSGGEPLMHPALDEIIRGIRARGMVATVITNGFLLSVDRIRRLNRAGVDHLQISIDNVSPDEISKKSLKGLDKRLEWLADHAEFDVTINAVVGAGTGQPGDALTIARRARALGFSTTVGILHDHRGQLLPLGAVEQRILEEVVAVGTSAFDFAAYNRFQKNLARGRPNEWQCRAGSRYLYVCEDGLVHWCSQQRGHPGIPLDRYGRADLEREHDTVKPCAPLCTVGCVHRVAQVDELREHPFDTLVQWFPQGPDGSSREIPASVKLLRWMFVTSPQRGVFRKVALRFFGVK